MELSVCSVGDVITDPVTGWRPTAAERHQNVVQFAVAIDEAGLAAIHVGEHHGLEYVFSAPPVILMAIAERTKNIRLGTGVTLVANLDPVRIAEDYATLDVLTGGRVEICAGRGNIFPDVYRLFGQPMETSQPRFEENLRLLVDLWENPVVSRWEGRFRAPLENFRLQPPPLQTPRPPISVGGGLSQSSAELAANLGLPLMLPVTTFQTPKIYEPVAAAYRERWADAGHDGPPRIGAAIHANIAATSQGARTRWAPRYRAYYDWTRAMIVGMGAPPSFFTEFDFDTLVSADGPCVCGSPGEFVDRLGWLGDLLGLEHVMLSLDLGGTPLADQLEQVELIGAQVLPAFAAAA